MADLKGQDGVSGLPEPTPCGVWGDSLNGPGVEGTSAKTNGVIGISLLPGRIEGQQVIEGGIGVYGECNGPYGTGVRGLTSHGTGVSGISTGGTGVQGKGSDIGVSGTSEANIGVQGNGFNYGVKGRGFHNGVSGETDFGIGVNARSEQGTGVQGLSFKDSGVVGLGGRIGMWSYNLGSPGGNLVSLSTDNLAGDFHGPVVVHGLLTKLGGGSFKIDHPLDPANKYLTHSFVESPDMKNLYDGIVELNGNGEAIVKLPDWFDALNMSCCYQLTSIGVAGPSLYIAEEVNNNQFKIAGGTPGMKVSWQVTGIRQDVWANANRIKVEEEKPADERGFYAHPQLHGQPEEKSLRHAQYSKTIKIVNEAKNSQPPKV